MPWESQGDTGAFFSWASIVQGGCFWWLFLEWRKFPMHASMKGANRKKPHKNPPWRVYNVSFIFKYISRSVKTNRHFYKQTVTHRTTNSFLDFIPQFQLLLLKPLCSLPSSLHSAEEFVCQFSPHLLLFVICQICYLAYCNHLVTSKWLAQPNNTNEPQ